MYWIMEIITIAGVVLCAWAMLRIMGNCRQEKLNELAQRVQAELEAEAKARAEAEKLESRRAA